MQPEIAKRLRDRLLNELSFELAMQVATKSNLETFDMWSAWGMSFLQLGVYIDARDKFRQCLHHPIGEVGEISALVQSQLLAGWRAEPRVASAGPHFGDDREAV